jgi:uroporphyrinogen-III synthase
MNGKTVAILENRMGEQLAALVTRHGGLPMRAPALSEVPDLDPKFIAALIPDLEAHPPKAVIFQTGVGTQALFNAADALNLTSRLLAILERTTVVVRSPKPAAALRSRSVRIDLTSKDPHTTTEVIEVLSGVPLQGERVVVQRYGVVNEALDRALEARGAQVVEVPVYRWSLPADTKPLVDLFDALALGRVDAVAFTTAAQVRNLFQLADQLDRRSALTIGLENTLVASIGPVCTKALEQYGIQADIEANPPKLGPFVQALNKALQEP